MALFDFEKTTIKLPFAITLISISLMFSAGVWRFETNMADLKASQEDLRKEIVYKYTIEIMKINNRIDLIEAKKFVQRRNFASDTLSVNTYKIVQNKKTNRGDDKKERHPQVCMILPARPECQRKNFNIKKLVV
tara:strand:+ start:6204 stop:6605 length:402 start_codon:yes stop_codon:yes gene_type:complete